MLICGADHHYIHAHTPPQQQHRTQRQSEFYCSLFILNCLEQAFLKINVFAPIGDIALECFLCHTTTNDCPKYPSTNYTCYV